MPAPFVRYVYEFSFRSRFVNAKPLSAGGPSRKRGVSPPAAARSGAATISRSFCARAPLANNGASSAAKASGARRETAGERDQRGVDCMRGEVRRPDARREQLAES